ncbi:MAG: SPOR domain-containing protein [Geminicoccaceae bacterium]
MAGNQKSIDLLEIPPYEEYGQPAAKKGAGYKRLLLGLLLIGVFVIFGATVWSAYQRVIGPGGEAPIVAAPEGPLKILATADAAGDEQAGQGGVLELLNEPVDETASADGAISEEPVESAENEASSSADVEAIDLADNVVPEPESTSANTDIGTDDPVTEEDLAAPADTAETAGEERISEAVAEAEAAAEAFDERLEAAQEEIAAVTPEDEGETAGSASEPADTVAEATDGLVRGAGDGADSADGRAETAIDQATAAIETPDDAAVAIEPPTEVETRQVAAVEPVEQPAGTEQPAAIEEPRAPAAPAPTPVRKPETEEVAALQAARTPQTPAPAEPPQAPAAPTATAPSSPAPQEDDVPTRLTALGDGVRLQLIAVRPGAEDRAWQTMRDQYRDILGDKRPYFEAVSTDGGVFARVQVGPFADVASADAACVEIKDRGGDCFVVTPRR